MRASGFVTESEIETRESEGSRDRVRDFESERLRSRVWVGEGLRVCGPAARNFQNKCECDCVRNFLDASRF
jgi:hypothetical protein